MELLQRVLDDTRSVHALIDRNLAIQALYAKATALYHAIKTKGLENERSAPGENAHGDSGTGVSA